ncbi:MAG TPA: hypothetical protein DDY57_10985 [Franconibacter pulveris]|nr:hypothetical protein [Franconibacter pulveris]
MLRALFSFFQAAGSILNLMPATDYSLLLDDKSDAEALSADTEALGEDYRKSMKPYASLNTESRDN